MIFPQDNFIRKIDQIYDYQQKIIQNSFIFVQLPKPIYKNNSKHNVFEINSKIQQLVGNQHHNLRLIGWGSQAYIEAYIYSILILALTGKKSFIQFKKCIYNISQKYLQLEEQKMLVQFFYMIQNTTDKFTFLKKYPIVQNLLIKIFNEISQNNCNINNNNKIIISSQQQQIRNSNNSYHYNINKNTNINTSHYPSQIYGQKNRISSTSSIHTCELINSIQNVSIIYQKLTQIFSFLILQKYTQYTYTLSIDEDNKIHIINQKQFYFVLHSPKFNFQKKNNKKGNQIEKIEKKQKLDKNQVKRLLNQSIQFDINKPHKKQFLSFLSNKDKLKLSIQNIQDINNGNINSLHFNEQNAKKISTFSINEKKQQKFIPFNNKSQFQQKSTNINNLTKDQRKIQYIDLMQSSFQDQDSTKIQNSTSNLINEQKINNYRYKYTYKNIQKKQPYQKYENKSNKSPDFLCRSPTFRANTKEQQTSNTYKQQIVSPIKHSKNLISLNTKKQSFDFNKLKQLKLKQQKKSQKHKNQQKKQQNKQTNLQEQKNKTKSTPTFLKSFNRISLQNKKDLQIFKNQNQFIIQKQGYGSIKQENFLNVLENNNNQERKNIMQKFISKNAQIDRNKCVSLEQKNIFFNKSMKDLTCNYPSQKYMNINNQHNQQENAKISKF